MRKGIAVAICATLIASLSLPALSQSSYLGEEWVETLSTTIGDEGTLFRIQAGTHLDLFPDDPRAGWSSVLALDVVREGALAERIVIPGTEGPDVESEAAVVFDQGQLFVLWQSRASANRTFLDLIEFTPADSSWSETIEVSGDPIPLKGPPQIAITRETVVVDADEGEEAGETTRTAVHVMWWESESASAEAGDVRVLYTPIILEGGAFLGWNPVIELDPADFPISEELEAGTDFSDDLLFAASLDHGTDPRSVVIGLPSADSGKLHNLIIRLLPDSLVDLAEHARSHIVGVGLINQGDVTGGIPTGLIDIAENARSHIVGVGRIPLHRGVREYVGGRVFNRIVELGSTYENDPEAFWIEVESAVWDEVVVSGASLLGNQLQNEDLPCGILHLGEGGLVAPGAEASDSLHQLEFCVGSEFPLPATTEDIGSDHRVVLSDDATAAVVAWEDEDGTVRYRQTEDGAWSEALTVPDSDLTLADALKILSRKVRTL